MRAFLSFCAAVLILAIPYMVVMAGLQMLEWDNWQGVVFFAFVLAAGALSVRLKETFNRKH